MGNFKHSSKASAAFSFTFYFRSMFALLSKFPRQKTGMKVTHVQPCTVTAQWQVGIWTTYMLLYTQTQHIYLFKEHQRVQKECACMSRIFMVSSRCTVPFLERNYENIDIFQVWLSPHLQTKRFQLSNHSSGIFFPLCFKSHICFFLIYSNAIQVHLFF